MIQGGGEHPTLYSSPKRVELILLAQSDFTKRNGMGGESIYGSPFPDEDLTRPLDSKGCELLFRRRLAENADPPAIWFVQASLHG